MTKKTRAELIEELRVIKEHCDEVVIERNKALADLKVAVDASGKSTVNSRKVEQAKLSIEMILKVLYGIDVDQYFTAAEIEVVENSQPIRCLLAIRELLQ